MKSWLPLLLGALTGLGHAQSPQAYLTTADRSHLLAPTTLPRPSTPPATAVRLLPSEEHQAMVGYGAAITEGSAWLIRHALKPEQQAALLNELFGQGPTAVGFNLTRLTIGASDFSRRHYSLDDMPPGQTDTGLAHFSLEPERADVIPLTRAALAVNPGLQVMASPWSAPGWMKSTDSLIKGRLLPQYYDAFARYLVRYAEGMAAEGVPLFALTLQNEPHFEPDDYPGMRLDPRARAAVVGQHLGPLLAARRLPIKLLDWDHNWDEAWSPLSMLADPVARRYVAGVAWHCYAGDPSAQSRVAAQYPQLEVWLTECSSGEWHKDWRDGLLWTMRHLVIGGPRNGARGVLMWNLALDTQYGPHTGGCKDCHGMVSIDRETGAVSRNMEYYAFGHASRFVRPGAKRVGSETQGADRNELDHVAFRNPDGGLVLVLANSQRAPRDLAIEWPGGRWALTVPASSALTLVLPAVKASR
jgi:glucosylceramidase